MSLTVRPFGAAFLAQAAVLLADRHRAAHRVTPALPAGFEDTARLLPLLEQEIGGTGDLPVGVAATDGDGLTGFLLARMPLPDPQSLLGIYFPSHYARVQYAGWGVRAGSEHEAIRVLYAELAPALIRRGSFHHVVTVGAHEGAAQRAWRSVGFGRRLAVGLRATSPVAARSSDTYTIRRGTIADLDTFVRLVSDNDRHHATPPILEPFMPETPAVHHAVLTDLLKNPECSAWMAEDARGRCLGIHTYSVATVAMQTPERCVYLEDGYTVPGARGLGVGTALLAAGMEWARAAGHQWCAISWNTDNLLGARFWQAHGFRPLLYRLRRSVDPRVAWAGAPA